MATERKKGAKGAARSELVAVRFDPRTKFLLDVAARVQRRSIANYVEWAVDESLDSVQLDARDGSEPRSVQRAGDALWHVLESVRMRRLAKTYPHLLTSDEEMLLNLTESVISSYPLDQRDQTDLFDDLWRAVKGSFGDGAKTKKELMRDLQDQGLSTEHIDKRIEELEERIFRLNGLKEAVLPIVDAVIATGGTADDAKRAGEELARRVRPEMDALKKKA